MNTKDLFEFAAEMMYENNIEQEKYEFPRVEIVTEHPIALEFLHELNCKKQYLVRLDEWSAGNKKRAYVLLKGSNVKTHPDLKKFKIYIDLTIPEKKIFIKTYKGNFPDKWKENLKLLIKDYKDIIVKV